MRRIPGAPTPFALAGPPSVNLPGVLASGGYHFTDPGLIATVGTHICVFGSGGVRVLTDPLTRPAAADGKDAGP